MREHGRLVQPGGCAINGLDDRTIITKDFPAPHLVRLRMHVEDRQRHWPGQHYLIRLRAPDDYTAQRSYSVASDDSDPLVEFLVEKLPDGEVSEFLADVAEVGDVLEVRGPIGEITPLLAGAELAQVCGSSRVADFAATLLIESGMSREAIRVEQFAATG